MAEEARETENNEKEEQAERNQNQTSKFPYRGKRALEGRLLVLYVKSTKRARFGVRIEKK